MTQKHTNGIIVEEKENKACMANPELPGATALAASCPVSGTSN
jgi:hypothetical protein